MVIQMTDRHIHCVYFQYDDVSSANGKCLLKNKEIEYGFRNHCDDYVLRPMLLLSYFLKYEGYCGDLKCANKKALDFLDRSGLNTYPKIQKNDGDME